VIAPYGTWQSPISADLVARQTGRPNWVGVVGDEIWWTEPRPTEGGRVALMRRRPDGTVDPVLPAPWNVRTRVIEYGGKAWCPAPGGVVFAKAAATLDHLSGGRVAFGIGVGMFPEEYAAVGMEFKNRGKRMDEYIDAIRVLWRDDVATFHGQYVSFEQMECRPWPVNRAIPLHIGGASDAAIRRAAQKGDGYFPFVYPDQELKVVLPQLIDRVRNEARAFGRAPDQLEFTSGGARTVEEAKWYAEVGVHRITLAIRGKTIAEVRDELRRFADQVISKTTAL